MSQPPGPPPPPWGNDPWHQPAYGAPGAPPPGYGVPYGYGGRENHGGATASMVLGIVALTSLLLSFVCCGITAPGVLAAPAAWVTGALAKGAIDAAPERYGNRGMAEAGVVMGIIGTVLAVLALVAVVAFFGLASRDLTYG